MGKVCFGIDVGGTTVKIGLFTTEAKLIDSMEIPTRKESTRFAICASSFFMYVLRWDAIHNITASSIAQTPAAFVLYWML